MIKPAGYKVLVKPDPIEEYTESGIEIIRDNPDKEKASQQTGELIAVGSKAWTDLCDGGSWAEVGDKVAYAKYGGAFINDPEDPDQEYVLLNDKDINAVIVGEQ